jgi:hypothetical protein
LLDPVVNDPEQKSQTKTVRTSDRTPAYESGGQEFESLRARHDFKPWEGSHRVSQVDAAYVSCHRR